MKRLSIALVALLCLVAGSTLVNRVPVATASISKALPVVAVSGNRFVNKGNFIQFRGVNRAGLEYACIQGWGFFDGPSDDASIAAMASWGINIVRLPLNEDCWLGINSNAGNAPYMGAIYRSTVQDYVTRLHAHGLAVILDLQVAEPGTTPSNGVLEPMPDADHAPAFWTSVATMFSADHSVVFDLFNEPHNVTWPCWRNGCTVTSQATGTQYQSAGMQSLVTAVRNTGATNVVILGGLAYSSDMTGWLANAPVDPATQMAVSFHNYNFSPCGNLTCWKTQVAPVAKTVPIMTGELGENDCAAGFVKSYMPWADNHHISYVAWTWDTWNCNSGPALISDYTGTPTAFGQGIHDYYLTKSGPPPTTTTTNLSTTTTVISTTTTTSVGNSWVNITPSQVSTDPNSPPNNYGFNTVVIDPTDPHILFMGTNYQGLWKSVDQGGTWTKINTGAGGGLLDQGRLWTLAIDPFDHKILWTTSGYGAGGPLKSTDGGVSWTLLPVGAPSQYNDVYSINVDPYTPNHVLVAWHSPWSTDGVSSGVTETADGGATWTNHPAPAGSNWGAGNAAWFLDTSHTWLLGSQNGGIWRTSNSGANWTMVRNQNITHGGINALVRDPATGTLSIATQVSIGISTDDGLTWTDPPGLSYNYYETVVSDGTNLYTAGSFPVLPGYGDGAWYSMPIGGSVWKLANGTGCVNGRCNGPIMGAYDTVSHVGYSVNWLGGVWKHQG